MLLILLVLVGLAVRLDAAPAADPLALARRYADILTGDDEPDDDVRDPDDADEADEDAAPAGTASTEGDTADGDAGEDAWRATTGDDEGRAGRVAGDGVADSDGRVDGDGSPGGGPGALALLDAEQAPLDTTTIEAARTASASAGAAEAYESWMRRLRPSLWGRLDVGVSWRRRWSQPRFAPAQRSDEVWLFATWRR